LKRSDSFFFFSVSKLSSLFNSFCLAGVGKLADGKAFTDPEVLRRLTSSVSCALDEAAAALTRMRTQNNGLSSSAGQTTADSGWLDLTVTIRIFGLM